MLVKILLADDDKITRALLGRWLKRWGYEVIFAADGEEALGVLLGDPEIRICVLDWMMPKMNGPEVCRALREQRVEPYVYTSLLTAKTETDDVIAGLKAGADDYIQKPCHPLELEVRLRVGRRLVDLQQSLVDAREKLRFEASHDGLTQLLNREAIMRVLGEELQKSQDTGKPTSVVMMDVDHFKRINDSHGHVIGDAVLRELPRRIARGLRAKDQLGRYGGEEFLVVLRETDSGRGLELAERIRLEVAALPLETGSGPLDVRTSVGVASSEMAPLGRKSADDLIRAADAALYRSKAGGRNQVSLANAGDFLPIPITISGSAA